MKIQTQHYEAPETEVMELKLETTILSGPGGGGTEDIETDEPIPGQ